MVQTTQNKNEPNKVLDEVKTIGEEVKENMVEGLNDLGVAARRKSEGVMAEVETFHTLLYSSYSNLGKDFKTTFNNMLKEISEQRDEIQRLRD